MRKPLLRVAKRKRPLKLLIVLHGAANTGKSMTLIRFCKGLIDESLDYYELKKECRSRDRKVVARMGKWIIGVSTAGDTPDLIKEGIRFIISQRCDIGVVAVRDSGTLLDVCKRYVKRYNTRIAVAQKSDVCSKFIQKEYSMLCADVFLAAIRKTRIREIAKQIEMDFAS